MTTAVDGSCECSGLAVFGRWRGGGAFRVYGLDGDEFGVLCTLLTPCIYVDLILEDEEGEENAEKGGELLDGSTQAGEEEASKAEDAHGPAPTENETLAQHSEGENEVLDDTATLGSPTKAQNGAKKLRKKKKRSSLR